MTKNHALPLRLVAAVLLLGGCAATPPPENLAVVVATLETEPVESEGDAADDVAIWLDRSDPARSLVIATQKQSGVHVYDLAGRRVQVLRTGRPNNVDLRYDFPMPDGSVIDLVATTNRSFNGVNLLRVDAASHRLVEVAAARERTDLSEIYGLCLGQEPGSLRTFAYANSKDGTIYQYEASGLPDGRVALARVRVLKLPSQVEGCVVDDEAGRLFVGEEAAGVWRFDAWPEGSDTPTLIAAVGEHGLAADVEGLAIAATGPGYLVASSQGNDSFAVYTLAPPHGYRGSFALVDGTTPDGDPIDGSQETDGLEVNVAPLGPFAGGLLVVQDGENTRPAANQNFKYVQWAEVVAALGL